MSPSLALGRSCLIIVASAASRPWMLAASLVSVSLGTFDAASLCSLTYSATRSLKPSTAVPIGLGGCS